MWLVILFHLLTHLPPTGTGSSTLTYLLMDEATKEVLIVDPVLEQARAVPMPSPHNPISTTRNTSLALSKSD